MKRLLAIALAFLTLVAGALLAPAATATEKGLFIIEGVGVVCGVRRVVAG